MSAPIRLFRARPVAPDAPAPLGDEAIARACAAGDAAAIGELFDRFEPRVSRYVHRLLGGSPDVEDVVQATFVEVARGKAAYDGRASVTTWLFAIATNMVRHQRRSRARRARLLEAVAAEPTPHASADGAAVARVELPRAQRALAALPEDLREAFVLCDLEGLSARDAAAALGVSEAAVWKRASRARAELRRVLGEGDR